jgi:prepilin-type N-terminal cleavage/methylation domain-containing protein
MPPRTKRGFTLIEMSIAMTLALSIGAIMVTLLQQQISFHRIMRAQNFLVQEAPQINNTVSKILNRADAYRLHVDITDAVSDAGAVTAGGKVLVVGFLNPDGTQDFGMVAFETIDGKSVLGYYNLPSTGAFTGAGHPDWIISRRVQNVDFFVEHGVFRLKLFGPAGESITYSGTPRL